MNSTCAEMTKKVRFLSGLVALTCTCLVANGWAQSGGTVTAKPSAKPGPVVEECKRCHDVKTYLLELSASPHARDKNGKEITCDQCHAMHFKPITNYYARAEYKGKKIFRPEDFDRRTMQKNARGGIPPEKCQACHKDLYRNAKGDGPVSPIGRLCHDAYLGKNGNTKRKCAGCHINIAHLPPFDRDAPYRSEFAKKLAQIKAAVKKAGAKAAKGQDDVTGQKAAGSQMPQAQKGEGVQ